MRGLLKNKLVIVILSALIFTNCFGKEEVKATIKEAAEKWNLSVRRVQTICNEGMIEGAMKFGNTWAIPKNAVKPADKRIKSGKYIKS